MSFGFNQIKWDTVGKAAEKEVAVRTSVSELESGGASKILDAEAEGKLLSLDTSGELAKVIGRVNFKLLYLDTEGEIRGLDYFADFSETIQIDSLSGDLCAKITVIDIDASVSGGIRLNAVVQITLFSNSSKEVSCLTSVDDDYYAETAIAGYQKYVTTLSRTFSVTDDFDTKTDVLKIVLTNAKSYVDSVTAGTGTVLVTGGVIAAVTYLDEGGVKTAEFAVPFSEEFEDGEILMGQTLNAAICVKNVKVLLTGVEGSNVIRIEVENEVTVRAFEGVDDIIVSDVFSVTNELEVGRGRLEGGISGGFAYFDDTVSGVAELSPEAPSALEIIGVISTANNVAQTLVGEDEITVEGVFSATILYRDENGTSSVVYEMPYSLPFMYKGVEYGYIVTAKGIVAKASAKLKRDREIEISATLGFMTETIIPKSFGYIAEIAVGAEKEANNSAVSVYVAEEGEGFWDAAKALSARPDDLRAQNVGITAPFKEGDRIFYFRSISFEF